MPLNGTEKTAMLAATREVASALLEDIEHIRSVLDTKKTSRTEVRYLSTTLRRLLVNRELAEIAAPRMGKISLLVPDNKPYMRLERASPFRLFVSGGAKLFGPVLRPILVPAERDLISFFRDKEYSESIDWQATVPVKLDNFLSQQVLCIDGNWITRREVIKFVTILGSGAHSNAPTTPQEVLLAKLRNVVSITSDGTNVTARLKVALNSAPIDVSPEFQYKPEAMDVVLYELLSAAHYFLMSPDVSTLAGIIKAELSA